MEHRKLDEIGAVAEIVTLEPFAMGRRERLERWAEILDRHPGKLTALTRVEYLPASQRALARAENSPLEIAFADPVLREEGLAGDRLGDIMSFFEIGDRQAHRLFCDCHYDGSMTGTGVARRLRLLARGGWRAWFV